MREFSKRVLKPLSLPLGAALFIGVLVFSLSRILLAVPELGSTAISLLIAAEVLGVGAVLAAATRLRVAQRAVLLLAGLALVAGGGTSAAIGTRHIEAHGTEVVVAAKDIEFDKQTLEVPADSPVDVRFVNNDAGVPHNVSIYRDKGMTDAILEGEIFNGVATRVYEVEPLPAGSYPFRCDVHPQQMVGEVVAGEGGGGHGGPSPAPTATATPTAPQSPTSSPTAGESPAPGEGPEDVDLIAEGFAFDKASFELAAETQVTIHFENRDQAPHNVVIAENMSADPKFRGEPLNSPGHAEYSFSVAAGTYEFWCEFHPNMKGTATFR